MLRWFPMMSPTETDRLTGQQARELVDEAARLAREDRVRHQLGPVGGDQGAAHGG